AVTAAAIGVRYLLSPWPRYAESVTVGTVAGGLIAAGAVLSRDPWRSVDGYIGHSAGVQFIALLSVAMLSASTVAMDRRLRSPSVDTSNSPRPVIGHSYP
ncbi:MAG: hypothetical protein WBV64_15845, partial [Mycobacterium sp.]